MDKVDLTTQNARRRARATSSLATRQSLPGPPHAGRGPRNLPPHRALARRAHLARVSPLGRRWWWWRWWWRSAQWHQAASRRRRAHVRKARRGRALFEDAHPTGARRNRGDNANRGRARALVDRARGSATERHAGFCGAHARSAPGGMGDPKILAAGI